MKLDHLKIDEGTAFTDSDPTPPIFWFRRAVKLCRSSCQDDPSLLSNKVERVVEKVTLELVAISWYFDSYHGVVPPFANKKFLESWGRGRT